MIRGDERSHSLCSGEEAEGHEWNTERYDGPSPRPQQCTVGSRGFIPLIRRDDDYHRK